MNHESSTFKPEQPAPIEIFIGHLREWEDLNNMVKAAALGNLKVGFVSGERGIGKRSLVSFVRRAAEQNHNTMGAHVFRGEVQEVQTLNGMLRQTFDTSS